MRAITWATFVGLVLIVTPAFGQCPGDQILTIPVTLDGNTPVLSAQINGIEARLVFDTGGASTMLMNSAVAKFGLDTVPSPPDAHYMSYGVPVDLNFARAKEFSYAGQIWRDETLTVTDGGDGIDGFVGQSHMRQDDVEIDLAGGVIRYFKPGDCPDDRVAYWANRDAVSVVELEDRNRIFGAVVVNGVSLRALFDTGSSFSNFAASGAAKAGVTPSTAASRR